MALPRTPPTPRFPSSMGSHTPAAHSTKVIVAGKSEVVCAPILESLKSMAGVEVIAQPVTGGLVRTHLRQEHVDVVVMDIGMREIDGLKAIPKILAVDPDVKIIMVATLTFRNVKIIMDGLVAGAVEIVTLPVSRNKKSIDSKFRLELTSKVKALARARRRPPDAKRTIVAPVKAKIQLREPSSKRPEIIAIGSSTGGPRVLVSLFEQLPPVIPQPILITQHMPASFMTQMAGHITKAGKWVCELAKDGEELKSGRVYLAPGDVHMTVAGNSIRKRIRLTDDPPVNYCRPAVDPMFTSLAKVYGPRVLGIIFTGMGRDGLAGSRKIVEAGGTVIAQDEESSIVWGMPAAVAEAGICSKVDTPEALLTFILNFARKNDG